MPENLHFDLLTEAPKPRRRTYSRIERAAQALAGITIAIGVYAYGWTESPGFGIVALAVGLALAFSLKRDLE